VSLPQQSPPPRPSVDRFGAPASFASDEPAPFVIDLDAVVATIRARARAIAACAVVGALTGVGVVMFVPPRFDGRAMVLIRTSSADPMSMVRGRIGPLAELMPGALGGESDEELSTELALLTSRATLGTVVDSLRLQVIARSPARVPSTTIVDSLALSGRFKPLKVSVAQGQNRVATGLLWARTPGNVKLLDREDAIDQLDERLTVNKIAGNAIEIHYRARDSVSAAVVPNLVAAVYMSRRKTVDRGLNQRRLEFLTAKADSVRIDLRNSADVLAATARRSGIGASPDIGARALADEASALESRLAELRATERSLDSLIRSPQGRLDVRTLAGFPDLLRSPALNELLSQMSRVETERTILLARVPETNPMAIALGKARDSLSAQLLPIASSYLSSIQQTRASLDLDLVRVRSALALMPTQSAAVLKEQAEVTRLGQMNAGMGAQVLEARLAALLEGGDIRVVDPAVSPRRVTFPRPLLTLAFFIALGFAVGLLYALTGIRQVAHTRTS
jgi:uncharacterized protein involved in exopolysaccharide biosynthesis